MPASRQVRFGHDAFVLDAGMADAIEALRHHDPAGALAMARRHQRPLADGQSVRVSMLLMDGAPAALPSPSAQSSRTTPMTTSPMVPIKIGDATHYVDPAIVRELEYARGLAAGYEAVARGAVQPPATRPVTDAAQDAMLAARDALRAQQARNGDPSTPQGKYRQYLRDAHMKAR